MGSVFGSSSNVTKMEIKSYKLMTCTGSPLESIKLQLNPETISLEYGIDYNSGQNQAAVGESAPVPQSAVYSFPDLAIETVVDDTGVVPLEGDFTSVEKYIAGLKKVVYNYIDETHGPPYVAISWGSVPLDGGNDEKGTSKIFKGQLSSLNVTYELFSQDGKPIRAKLSMKFKALVDPAKRPTGNSPDLTHFHEVRMGDNLPALSTEIYGDPSYYLQLARLNGLSSIYQLTPGQRLILPPLDKGSR